MISVLDDPPGVAFKRFLWRCKRVGIDAQLVYDVASAMRAFESETARHNAAATELSQRLETRWYASLEAGGEPDWGVYVEDEYLAEAWYCWSKYSRNYVRHIRKEGAMPNGKKLVDVLRPRRVADLGCGIGYSTAGLKELWPHAQVTGTNIGTSKQVQFVKRLAAEYKFKVETRGLQHVGPVDLVFASEYFEHFHAPLQHLAEVLEHLQPRAMLIANAFTNRSTGHFPTYEIDGELVPGKGASKRFNDQLRSQGFTKVPFKVWNSRPSLWVRGKENR